MDLQPIQDKIHEIRGIMVMLDFDLAERYRIETRVLKQAVRRNMERFPDDFMFELTRDEYNHLRSQFVTLEVGRGKYSKYLPFAFTEQGVAMLSTVLNSKTAIAMNINIMRAFVVFRNLMINPPINETKELQKEVRELKQYVEDIFTYQNDINEDTRMQLELINESLAGLQAKNRELKPRNPIGFNAPQYKSEKR